MVGVLPTHQCRAKDDTARQFDAAYQHHDVLVIVECKAIARSIAYTRGDSTAQQYRFDKLTKAIAEADDKARWIAERPVGRNYQLPPEIRWICPVVVTPFTEFIPTLDEKWWLHVGRAGRVMKPSELAAALKGDAIFTEACLNLVPVRR
jgi:hypothetical protein